MVKIAINSQPTDETCGPTCLHAIYRYYDYEMSLEEVIASVERSRSGGTLSPLLGKHALMRGFDATIYVNNMILFDPTWFKKSIGSSEVILSKLKAQEKYKQAQGITQASEAFQDFLNLGGQLRFKTIDPPLLKEYLDKKTPILTGLSSTYLYRSPRECYTSKGESFADDIQGTPCGHFVILSGYDAKNHMVSIADPYYENALSKEHNYYKVSASRVINAIMLGVVTYDSGYRSFKGPIP